VIRSVAAWRADSGAVVLAEGPVNSSKARIAIRANADSETPLLAANFAKRSFSTRVGRAVMDGIRAVGLLLFTRHVPLVQQNADTSLSCHQNNTDSKADSSNSDGVTDIEWIEQGKQPSRSFPTNAPRHGKERTADQETTA
jgi:hypothetical protein